MLFLKLEGYHELLKPFLVLLRRMPDKLSYNDTTLYSSDIVMNANIIEVLRKI